MSLLCKLTAEEVVLLAGGIAAELAKDRTYEELVVIRNIAGQVSQSLLTIASHRQLLEKRRKDE